MPHSSQVPVAGDGRPAGERPPESPRLTTMKRVAVAALSVALLTLPACGSSPPPGSSTPPTSSTAPGSSRDIFAQRAQQVVTAWTEGDLLARWRTSLIAAEGLTIEPDWTPRGDLKASFGNGWVRSATALPTAEGTGEVRYAVDGTTVRVRTVAAQAAYDAMVNPRVGECPHAEDGSTDCAWVTITGVRAGTATILSSRGKASVPTWEFTVKGLSTPLVRVAVADALEPEDLRPPLATPPVDGRQILLYSQVVTATEGRTLTVALGSGDCDTHVTGRFLETADLVVVGGTGTGPTRGTACTARLRIQDVTFTLAKPVGARAVVDAASGRPLLPQPVARS